MNRNFDLAKLKAINQSTYKTAVVGIRPFRKRGLRIQFQQLEGKSIIHNYGHGGAGISLAPATSEQAVSLLVQKGVDPKQQPIGILGSGINGLFSALFAARLGYQVKVYAQRIPSPDNKNSEKICTSQVPPGYWLPYSYDFSDRKKHESQSLKAYIHYMNFSRESKSINLVNVYQTKNEQFNSDKLPLFIRKNCETIQMAIGNIKDTVYHFKTFQINLEGFLQHLIQSCLKLNVEFVSTKFQTIKDVCELKPQYLINCLGMGSKKIFNDQEMYGVKGYLLEYRNTGLLKSGIYAFNSEGKRLKFYIFADKILATVLQKFDDESLAVDENKVQEIKKTIYHFIHHAFDENTAKL